MWLGGKTCSHIPAPADFPAEALVQVETIGPRGALTLTARVVGASSDSHLRIRTDDGLVFLVPGADCRPIERSAA